jgi:hypothetical protein
MEPTPDPIAFTRDRLQEIAVVWRDATKRKLAPLMEKVPAPIARYLKPRTNGADAPATPSDVAA